MDILKVVARGKKGVKLPGARALRAVTQPRPKEKGQEG